MIWRKNESEINDRLELGSKNAHYLINFKYLQYTGMRLIFFEKNKESEKVKISLNPPITPLKRCFIFIFVAFE